MAWGARIFFVGLLGVALGGGEGCDPRRSSEPASGYFVRAGAPAPTACAADDECVSGPAVDPSDGCCDSGVHLEVLGRAYVEWRAAWVAENCGGHVCPPIPSPALPAACAVEGRCVEGRCVNTCEARADAPR